MGALGPMLAAALALWPGAAGAQSGASFPALFGTREIRSTNLTPFTKWTSLLERQLAERRLYDTPCGARRGVRCAQEWQALVRQIKGREPMAQLEAVHRFMNQARYIEDPVNYGVPDYWATPMQFLTKEGDCEDYAIGKYFSLLALGFEKSQMRILVLDDLNLRLAHAILIVYLDGRAFVLDNQIQRVVTADTIRHYRPIFSINEEGWWLHRPPL